MAWILKISIENFIFYFEMFNFDDGFENFGSKFTFFQQELVDERYVMIMT